MKIFAGIDGGGTQTRLALADENGALLSFAKAPSCSFVENGLEVARERLDALWRAAWKKTGQPGRAVEALFMGMGSILAPHDARINCELAVSLEFVRPNRVRAENDAFNALAGGLCGRPGILLISGTGSACFGRNAQGKTWRAGGWGYRLHDPGSAYAFGLAAIIAVTRQADKRGQPTALTAVVREALGIREIADIFRRVHSEKFDRADVASLAPLVVETAARSDQVARRILTENADALVEMVLTVARELELPKPELALTGGLITGAKEFRRVFLERLEAALPGFRVAEGGFPPALGAVLLACELATGEKAPVKFLENLRASSAAMVELA
jgi:N-acetylglucosamine kinase-like BadF-type ATPase